jgi:hypothetical protein
MAPHERFAYCVEPMDRAHGHRNAIDHGGCSFLTWSEIIKSAPGTVIKGHAPTALVIRLHDYGAHSRILRIALGYIGPTVGCGENPMVKKYRSDDHDHGGDRDGRKARRRRRTSSSPPPTGARAPRFICKTLDVRLHKLTV